MESFVASHLDQSTRRPEGPLEGDLEALRRRMVEELEAFLERALKEPGRRWIELAPREWRVEQGGI
jgi:hypothetical protein